MIWNAVVRAQWEEAPADAADRLRGAAAACPVTDPSTGLRMEAAPGHARFVAQWSFRLMDLTGASCPFRVSFSRRTGGWSLCVSSRPGPLVVLAIAVAGDLLGARARPRVEVARLSMNAPRICARGEEVRPRPGSHAVPRARGGAWTSVPPGGSAAARVTVYRTGAVQVWARDAEVGRAAARAFCAEFEVRRPRRVTGRGPRPGAGARGGAGGSSGEGAGTGPPSA